MGPGSNAGSFLMEKDAVYADKMTRCDGGVAFYTDRLYNVVKVGQLWLSAKLLNEWRMQQ